LPLSCHRPEYIAIAQETTEDTPSTTEADERDGPDPLSRSPGRYLWTTLIARLFEQFPLTFRYCISAQAKGPRCRRFSTLTDDIQYVRFWPVAPVGQGGRQRPFTPHCGHSRFCCEGPLWVESCPHARIHT